MGNRSELPPHSETSYLLSRSVYETGFDDDAFDCIIRSVRFEHPEPRAYADIKRIQKPKLIVSTPKKRWNWFIELLSL